MAKLLKAVICFLAVLGLLSCSNANGVSGEITVRTLNGDEKIVLTDKTSIQTVKQAIMSAERVPGIVDVTFADFRMIAGEETYDLWLREDSGSIMNLKDTHTIYTLTAKSAKELNELLEPIIDKQ
ncbi:hypothetical protein V1499_17770 [Neobacillus sp. SCS-31]|uniref:hypothetical protein n=1 Tax=Neobacillus oceani TaxID=3115292 RepID=UPI003905E6CE